MAEIKLTKNELRSEQAKYNQLLKYLPTLQLKKAMLQIEVAEAREEIVVCQKAHVLSQGQVIKFAHLLENPIGIDLKAATKVKEIRRRYENIAGVEVPYFESIDFEGFTYSLLGTPDWVDSAIEKLKDLKVANVRIQIAEEKKTALEKELREVSIRVNLFEKILIPRAKVAIKKIKVFLGDQELAAVSRAKVAKKVLMAKTEESIL